MIKLTKDGKAHRKEFYDWLRSNGYYKQWMKNCKDYDKNKVQNPSFCLYEFNIACNNKNSNLVCCRFPWHYYGHTFWLNVNREYKTFKYEQSDAYHDWPKEQEIEAKLIIGL